MTQKILRMEGKLRVCLHVLLGALLLLWSVAALAQTEQPLEEQLPRGCRRSTLPTGKMLRRSAPFIEKGEIDVSLYRGDRRQLVVLASFSDRTFRDTEAETLELWDKLLNQKGYKEAPYVGSVRDYFYQQSYGQFRLTFDVQYVEVGKASNYASTNANDENSQYLVDDAMEILLTRDIDWSLYDWNGDGEVEQLLFVYAGRGMNDGWTDCIWPHQWWLSRHLDQTRTDGSFRKECTFTCGGKTYTVDCYCAVPELRADAHPLGFLCHEYSHCFGFPDYYDWRGGVVGNWDLMDMGYFAGGGSHPVGYSAHERMLMGWLTPIELTEPTQVTDMPALSDEPVAYIIRNDGHPDEFYMVENRQSEGWDAALPGSGLLVFHVDYDPLYWFSFSGMPNSGTISRYTIVPANGRGQTAYQAGWAYPYGENDELTDSSNPAATLLNPNSEGSYVMGKPLTNMAVTDGWASFDFMDGTSGIEDMEASEPSAEAASVGWYTLSGMRLSERPQQQGLYIWNGRKVLVK